MESGMENQIPAPSSKIEIEIRSNLLHLGGLLISWEMIPLPEGHKHRTDFISGIPLWQTAHGSPRKPKLSENENLKLENRKSGCLRYEPPLFHWALLWCVDIRDGGVNTHANQNHSLSQKAERSPTEKDFCSVRLLGLVLYGFLYVSFLDTEVRLISRNYSLKLKTCALNKYRQENSPWRGKYIHFNLL